MHRKAQVTWVVSTVATLVCSTASGSIFFLIARLLTVMVSVFTGCRQMREEHSVSQAPARLLLTGNCGAGSASYLPPLPLTKSPEGVEGQGQRGLV